MNKVFDLIKETLKGKSFYRILFNWEVARRCSGLNGVAVDLACGRKHPSYWRYWQTDFTQLIRVDSSAEAAADLAADLNNKIPLIDDLADNIFMFNSLYLIYQPLDLIKEIRRILKPGGRAFVTVQFIKSEESRAEDRYRWTSRRVKEMFNQAGFSRTNIFNIGGCFSAAGNLVDFAIGSSIPSKIFKLIFRPLCLLSDKLLPEKIKENYPCPIAWLVVVEK